MKRGDSLHLHEEIMLLVLRDREGTVQAMQAAILVACIVPAIVASTAAGH